jgi:hypothetical protein
MQFYSILKFLVPTGIWLRRTMILFCFIFLDYLVTIVFCKHPSTEGNIYARTFMQNYGIAAGLAIFDLLMAIPLYFILCVDSRLINLPKGFSNVMELLTDLGLGWLVAGAHFDGAMSWLWGAPSIVGQTIGLVIYELVSAPPLVNSRKLLLSRLW